jgi:hypothetical protein
MSNLMIRIHDSSTDEIIDREMNAEELAQFEAEKTETLIKAEIQSEKAAEKAALLAKLGITEAEAKLLLS